MLTNIQAVCYELLFGLCQTFEVAGGDDYNYDFFALFIANEVSSGPTCGDIREDEKTSTCQVTEVSLLSIQDELLVTSQYRRNRWQATRNARALIVLAILLTSSSIFGGSTTQTSPAKDDNTVRVDEALRQAQAAYQEGRLQQAIEKCHAALQLDPQSAHAYYLLGIIFTDQGIFPEAKLDLLRSIALDPSHIAAHVSLARLYMITKEWNSAEIEFHKAIELGDATGTGDYGIALTWLARSRKAEALPYLLAAVKANPQDPGWRFTLIATQLDIGQVVQARKNLVRIAQLSPNDPWLFYRLSNLLEKHHMLDEAADSLERSAALLSDRNGPAPPPGLSLPAILLDLGRIRFDQKDFRRSLSALGKMNTTSGSPEIQSAALYLEGKALLALGKPDQAGEKLRQATEENPAIIDIPVYWALAELQAGNLDTAAKVTQMIQHRWSQNQDIAALDAIIQRERAPERLEVPYNRKWHLKGEGIVCCPCDVPCPCRSNGRPTHGVCENTGVVRIERGYYGDVRLDGFTFAIIHDSMGPQNGTVTLYVTPSASDRQIIALERVFQSFNPLRLFTFLNVDRAPIHVYHNRNSPAYSVTIPDVLEIKIRRQLDSTGKPLRITAALDDYSNILEYAQNLTYKVWDTDGNLKWDYSGRQANYRTIDLDSDSYQNESMLIQFADWSGMFNAKQWALIRSLRLPTLSSYPGSGK